MKEAMWPKKFNEMGVAAFVLKYRLPSDSIMINKAFGPLQDAQRAIQMVRNHAKEWGIG
jgi:acetyl esterase/lipase